MNKNNYNKMSLREKICLWVALGGALITLLLSVVALSADHSIYRIVVVVIAVAVSLLAILSLLISKLLIEQSKAMPSIVNKKIIMSMLYLVVSILYPFLLIVNAEEALADIAYVVVFMLLFFPLSALGVIVGLFDGKYIKSKKDINGIIDYLASKDLTIDAYMKSIGYQGETSYILLLFENALAFESLAVGAYDHNIPSSDIDTFEYLLADSTFLEDTQVQNCYFSVDSKEIVIDKANGTCKLTLYVEFSQQSDKDLQNAIIVPKQKISLLFNSLNLFYKQKSKAYLVTTITYCPICEN